MNADKTSHSEVGRAHTFQRFISQSSVDGASSQSAAAAAGQSVLVTGAGGFIGSALVRAIAAAGPARLVLLDSSEQNLFAIHSYLEIPHEAILGSVTDAGLLRSVCRRFQPRMVYHAAALKHVPLLELNPFAAVRNNAIGTYTLAQAAIAHGVAAMVLVSTDKAVNPHSIMGASKRVAELIVTGLSGSGCRMSAIRLGNVIGSTGSVAPIFREQVARGGPVTVTHPEVRRYFMTLAEAVEAILAGGGGECGGRILLPELGEPENIAGLARFLIGAREIPVQFIGLRAGEKMNEDLMFDAEVRDGVAGRLQVIRTPMPAPSELHGWMAQLALLLAGGDLAGLIAAMRALVPEYQPSSVMWASAEI